MIRTKNEWDPHSRIIAIENTTNKGGGAFYTRDELMDIRRLSDEQELFVHLDGARIWNAIIASDIEPEFFGTVADTISICFSKGLGAPVGSMMLGSHKNAMKARRIRKMWGGGMRQIGILAAAAEYAVDHHFELLMEDHRRAKTFAKAISNRPEFSIDISTVDTNIVLFDVKEGTATDALKTFSEKGVEMVPFGPKTIRATFHFQVNDEDLEQVLDAIDEFRL